MTMQFCIILQRMAPNCRGKCMQTACQKLNSNFSLELLKHFPKSELGLLVTAQYFTGGNAVFLLLVKGSL